jgi:outer membrane protein assembly factor BamB
MKLASSIIAFAFLALLLCSALASEVSLHTVKADTPNTTTIHLLNIGDGQASVTNQTTHLSSYAAKLILPSNASQGSGCMVLYPYNKTLSSLQSFRVYTSYMNAVPRFVISVDTNDDGLTDLILLSDYQFASNGSWQLTQGGQRWGWTQASPSLDVYGKTWNDYNYWKEVYGNAIVLSVGVALEYWAVKDSNGLDQPLYADEAVINGVTYTFSNQPSNEYTVDNWSMYRHDLARTGLSTSPVSDGKLLWKFFTGPFSNSSLADRLRASPTVVDGVVYIGSNNSCFLALDAVTGSPIWQANVGANVESSAAVVDGVVYVGILWNGHNGYVDALNASTGSVIWQFATNSGIESSPAVVNGVVYIGSFYGYVYALNATNGALIWSYLTGGTTFSSPAAVDGVIYIGAGDGNVYALNANSGMLRWKTHIGNQVYASPAVVNGIVYVGSDDGQLCALKAIDGSLIWQANIGVGDHSDDSPAVANGIVYFGSRNGYYAFNATTGSQIWFFTSPYSPRQFTGYVYSSPVVAGNVVYFGSSDGYVFALDAFNGSIIWSYRTGIFVFSSPAIVNGVVYVGSYDGYVYALGTLSAPTPAPTTEPTAPPLSAPTSTPTPTVTPTPSPTPQPTATPNVTETPMPTPTPYQAPPQLSITHPVPEPMLAVANSKSSSDNWLMLGAIIVAAITALIYFLQVFRNSQNSR